MEISKRRPTAKRSGSLSRLHNSWESGMGTIARMLGRRPSTSAGTPLSSSLDPNSISAGSSRLKAPGKQALASGVQKGNRSIGPEPPRRRTTAPFPTALSMFFAKSRGVEGLVDGTGTLRVKDSIEGSQLAIERNGGYEKQYLAEQSGSRGIGTQEALPASEAGHATVSPITFKPVPQPSEDTVAIPSRDLKDDVYDEPRQSCEVPGLDAYTHTIALIPAQPSELGKQYAHREAKQHFTEHQQEAESGTIEPLDDIHHENIANRQREALADLRLESEACAAGTDAIFAEDEDEAVAELSSDANDTPPGPKQVPDSLNMLVEEKGALPTAYGRVSNKAANLSFASSDALSFSSQDHFRSGEDIHEADISSSSVEPTQEHHSPAVARDAQMPLVTFHPPAVSLDGAVLHITKVDSTLAAQEADTSLPESSGHFISSRIPASSIGATCWNSFASLPNEAFNSSDEADCSGNADTTSASSGSGSRMLSSPLLLSGRFFSQNPKAHGQEQRRTSDCSSTVPSSHAHSERTNPSRLPSGSYTPSSSVYEQAPPSAFSQEHAEKHSSCSSSACSLSSSLKTGSEEVAGADDIEDWGTCPSGLALDEDCNAEGLSFELLVKRFAQAHENEQRRVRGWSARNGSVHDDQGFDESEDQTSTPMPTRLLSGLAALAEDRNAEQCDGDGSPYGTRPVSAPRLVYGSGYTNPRMSPTATPSPSPFRDAIRPFVNKSSLVASASTPGSCHQAVAGTTPTGPLRPRVSLADFLSELSQPIDPSSPPRRPRAGCRSGGGGRSRTSSNGGTAIAAGLPGLPLRGASSSPQHVPSARVAMATKGNTNIDPNEQPSTPSRSNGVIRCSSKLSISSCVYPPSPSSSPSSSSSGSANDDSSRDPQLGFPVALGSSTPSKKNGRNISLARSSPAESPTLGLSWLGASLRNAPIDFDSERFGSTSTSPLSQEGFSIPRVASPEQMQDEWDEDEELATCANANDNDNDTGDRTSKQGASKSGGAGHYRAWASWSRPSTVDEAEAEREAESSHSHSHSHSHWISAHGRIDDEDESEEGCETLNGLSGSGPGPGHGPGPGIGLDQVLSQAADDSFESEGSSFDICEHLLQRARWAQWEKVVRTQEVQNLPQQMQYHTPTYSARDRGH